MSCVQSHACSWMSMAVCLFKSNKDVLFKHLGVFETEPVDPEILTVNVQQLFYRILWPYEGTTTESIASHQSRLNVYLCHVITNTCLPRMTREWESQVRELLKCQNNKQMLPSVLWIFSFCQDRRLIEDGDFGPQAEEADIIMVSYALEDAISGKNTIKVLSDDIGVLVLPVYLCHDKALQCKLQMQHWDSTALDINATGVELSTKGLQLPGM